MLFFMTLKNASPAAEPIKLEPLKSKKDRMFVAALDISLFMTKGPFGMRQQHI